MTKPDCIPKGALITSVSQHQNYVACPRSWFFDKVMRLPRPIRKEQTFGTVLHACVERYLLANSNETVPEYESPSPLDGQTPGDPVQIYPPGWHTIEERGRKASLEPFEQQLVKKLVAEAIEKGVVQRLPGGRVEHEFWRKLDSGAWVTGKIDYGNLNEVQDHKTAKDTKWLKAPSDLEKDFQLGVYSYATNLERMEAGMEPKVSMPVRHNQYVKGTKSVPAQVRISEANIDSDFALECWEKLTESSREMLDLRASNTRDWKDIEGPREPGACAAYGGCPKASICTLRETTESYTRRIEAANALLDGHPKYPGLKTRPMALRDMMKAGKPAASAPAATTKPRPAPEPDPEPVVEGEDTDAAPWFDHEANNGAGCSACRKNPVRGFNSKGKPCRICASKLEGGSRNPLHPNNYILETDDEGEIYWSEKESVEDDFEEEEEETQEEPEIIEPAPKGTKATTHGTLQKADKGKAARAARPVAAVSAPPEDQRVGMSDAELAALDKGRRGLTLLVGCVQEKGSGSNVYHLDRLLARLKADMENDLGQCFSSLNPFDRGDALGSRVRDIVAEVGNGTIICDPHPATDEGRFYQFLKPFAKTIIVPIGR